MVKKIRTVQVGIGHDHAASAWDTINKQSDLFDVLGWCPIDDEGERPCAAHYPPEKRLTLDEVLALPELDAVTVETDDWNLTRVAQIFADRGVAVQMDKPGAVPQDDFERLARTVKEKKVPFQIAYMYRFNPLIMRVVQDARDGVYGDISAVELHMDCEHGANKREWLARFPGGMLYFLGCHLIDLILQIKGVPDRIIPLSYRSGYDGAAGEDVGMAVFQYPNCVAFAKTSAVEAGGFMRRQLVVTGKKRSIELRPLEEYVPEGNGLLVTRMRDSAPDRGWNDDGVHTVSAPQDRYEDMFAMFAAIVRGEKKNPYSPEYECLLHRVILSACGEAIDYKTPVRL